MSTLGMNMAFLDKLALSSLSPSSGKLLGAGLALLPVAIGSLRRFTDQVSDQSIASLFPVLVRYFKVDFVKFMRDHRQHLKTGQETGNFVPGVCHYYSLMSDVITLTSGPFWHFVPMYAGVSRMDCHHRFHDVMVKYLEAKSSDRILEVGCGFGEAGRQVALRSGAKVTGLTMADEEIVGGNERIKAAGLEGQCNMVQGNYHSMPLEAESFDKVFGVYTLKYSADIDAAIAELARVLKRGGRLVSYEVLVTDKYDPADSKHKEHVDNISHSTCMPPLWHIQAFRDAARKAGLEPADEEDLCGPGTGTEPWYSCFERTGIFHLLNSPLLLGLIRFAEGSMLLPRGYTEWFGQCCVHPTVDFVLGGRLGIVSGAVMMTWRKP